MDSTTQDLSRILMEKESHLQLLQHLSYSEYRIYTFQREQFFFNTGASVPDIIAQRLVLINLGVSNSSSAKKDDLVRHSALIHSIGLSTSEAAKLTEIANQFAATWHELIERHNRDAAENVRSDISQLTVARDGLVTTTMDQIRDTLSQSLPNQKRRVMLALEGEP